MSYRSEYFLEEFENDEIKKLIIILNRIEIHNKKKYLLIVAKDLGANKIVKLIDTHGSKHNLCKYSDDWALLNKGDVISVKEKSAKSELFASVKDARVIVPKWLEFDSSKLTGKVTALPAREDIDLTIAEHLIIELYSK